MTDGANSKLIPGDGEIRMRLYSQGLGDCFLLAFPRRKGTDSRPFYLVIDCGVAMSTPDKGERMRKVVEDIHAATGGHIDALAITHQHFDHISGFQDAWQEWQSIRVDALYLPWTERTGEDGEHKSVKAFRDALERAARQALTRAAQEAAIPDTLDGQPGFRAQADFLGVSLDRIGAAALERPSNMDATMDFIRDLCPPESIRYFEPGDVFPLPETDFHAYVLGPPLAQTSDGKGRKYIELLMDEAAVYSYGPLGLKVDHGKPGGANAFALSDDHSLSAMASALLAVDHLDRAEDEGFCPFPAEVRLEWDQAMAAPYFEDHYGEGTQRGPNGAWRRIDTDWLAGAANLALRAGDYTNNLSLVLAFGMPRSEKMLLFPGDAQVGNWLSWHEIREWRFLDGSVPDNAPAPNDRQTLMENLLSRVAFYKVGHHGSHNATIRDKGLEAMTRDDLVAYLPVSVPVAQDLMGYCPMPFYPVVRALQARTKGRVFLPNGQPVGELPAGKTEADLRREAGIERSVKTLPAKRDKQGKVLEGEVPLYLELTLPAPPPPVG